LSTTACSHCNLEFSQEVMIHDGDHLFCCKGCQGVYHLLHDEGLDTFYDKRQSTSLQPVNHHADDLEKFDLDGFKERYITQRDDGLYQIHLIIEGIHCSACVWLNEKVLHKQEGIIEASINYSTHKAHIIWDSESINLSRIIEVIRSIGYNAYPYDPKLQEQRATQTRKSYYSRILVAVFGSMNIMWLAVAHYAGYFSGIEQSFKNILHIAEFVLATPVLFYSGWIFFRGAYYGYKNHIVNMDTLVASGALLAYAYSIYAMISEQGEVYFDSVAMIITFVLVGKYLEVLSKKQAVDTLDSMRSSTPTEVTRIEHDEKSLVSVEQIAIGDTLELKAGEKVAIDGKILFGEGSFDESSLTGESTPIYKREGDTILSGSLLLDSTLRYQATKDLSSSMLSSIISLLESALSQKPRLEQLANRISGYFSSTILLLALLTFASWYLLFGSFETALIVGISVIVIACPCALGLATPMATLVGVSISAKRGILFKEASHLETMAKANILALDKTGTITEGKPSVVDAKFINSFDLSLLYSLVASSNHPIAKGVETYLKSHHDHLQLLPITSIKSIQAKGLEATYQNLRLKGGNPNFVNSSITSDYSLFLFSIDEKVVAQFELSDTLRGGAKEAIANIQKMGIEVVMLTGDHAKSAKQIASQVGITQFHANLLPQEKSILIEQWQANGDHIIMAGDGINDTVALASSDLAIAMGSGADIAIGVSDVVLLNDHPIDIYHALRLSRKTFRTIKENLAFSLLYNLITIPIAMLGLVTPLIAALSMSLSSLVVVANSMRIRGRR
jgi:Cu+-exporting ATPase